MIKTQIEEIFDPLEIQKFYTSNEWTGFLPGQASLAYFFFLGSSGSIGWTGTAIGTSTTGVGGIRSTCE